MVRLHLLPTAVVPAPNDFQVDVGQTSTFGGAVAEGGRGTGNQTYQLRADLGIVEGVSAFFLFESNDDPTWDRIEGVRYRKEFTYLGGGLRLGLLNDPRMGLALEGALADFGLKSDAGLFTRADGYERDNFLVSSLSASLDLRFAEGWGLTLSPSVILPPDSTGGQAFLGPIFLLGAGLQGRLGERFSVFATGDAPLGPGFNHVDGSFRFRRVPVLTGGAVFAVSPQFHLTGYLTNGAGGTAVTRHMTLLGSVPTQFGVRLKWSPSQPQAPERPWRGLPGNLDYTADSRSGRSWLLTVALADVFDLEAGLVRTPGRVADERLGLNLGEGGEYRLGGRVLLLAQSAGHPLSLDTRVTVGQSLETQQGYLLAELRLTRSFFSRVSATVAPILAHNGGETPAGVGLELDGRLLRNARAFVRTLALATHRPLPWTAGVRVPLADALELSAWASTAQSPVGIGRFLAVPRELRIGTGLRVSW